MEKMISILIIISVFICSVAYGAPQVDKVKQNWSKLEEGMSHDEVEKLIGPICGDSAEACSVFEEFRSVAKSQGIEQKYKNELYSVEFDKDDKLIKWKLNK